MVLCLALLDKYFYLKSVFEEEYPPFLSIFTCSSPAPTRSYQMGADTISSTVEDFSSFLNTLNSNTQQRILGEYVKNPFLDDDAHALALRVGMAHKEVGAIVAELRQVGLLQSAGRRGHMLGVQTVRETSASTVDPSPVNNETAALPPHHFAPLLDALSCGVALIDVDTGLVEANEAFSQQLHLPSKRLDAEQLVECLKCDLRQIACAQEPAVCVLENGVRVELRSGNMGPFSGLIAVVDVGGSAGEISKAHVQIQEDLFAQLREEVTHPAKLLQSFLENPKKSELGQAREAIERIGAFLELYLLDDSSDQAPL